MPSLPPPKVNVRRACCPVPPPVPVAPVQPEVSRIDTLIAVIKNAGASVPVKKIIGK